MASDHTSEFLVLLDRYLAGDLDAHEDERLRELCSQNGAFELEFARARRFESLLGACLVSCGDSPQGSGTLDPFRDEFVSHPDFLFTHDEASASDASGIDLLAAGLLSAEDEAALRIDTSADVWLIDELRDADLLSNLLTDTLRQAAGDGPAQTFVGADRIDRYLAGDLGTSEVASLFADADDSTTLGIELGEARSFEAMMRGGLAAMAANHQMPDNSVAPITPWIGANEEKFERYLAGDLSSPELTRLEDAALSSPAIAARLQTTRNYEALLCSAFAAISQPEALAQGQPQPAPQRIPNSIAARRMRARRFLRRRRSRRQRQATLIVSSLIGVILIALMIGLWPRTSTTPADQDALLALVPKNQVGDTDLIGSGKTLTDPVRTAASVAGAANLNPEVAKPEAKAPTTNAEDAAADPQEADASDDTASKASPSEPSSDFSEDESQPSEAPFEDEEDVAVGPDEEDLRTDARPREEAWYDGLTFALSPELLAARSETLRELQTELAAFVKKDGSLDLEILQRDDAGSTGGRRKRHSHLYDQPLRHLSATYAIVLRAMLRVKAEQASWSTARSVLRPSFEALMLLWRKESQEKTATIWDDAEMLATIELWYRSTIDGSRRKVLKPGHRRLVSNALLGILNQQGADGLWGAGSPSVYGKLEDPRSFAHLIGREIKSDLYTSFSALRAIVAATKILHSPVDESVFQRLATGLLQSQSAVGESVSFERMRKNPNGDNETTAITTLARGWTLSGDSVNGETGVPLLRSGAMTASALYMLKVCQRNLSAEELRSVEAALSDKKLTFASAETDAVAWLNQYHASDRNPMANDRRPSEGTQIFRYHYLFALRKAFGATGDLTLQRRAFNVEITTVANAAAEKVSDAGWGELETLQYGHINKPIRRAYALLALVGE